MTKKYDNISTNSLLLQSVDWDTTFSSSEGLLNTEELCLVNKGFNKSTLKQQSSRTQTKKGDVAPHHSVSAVKRANVVNRFSREHDGRRVGAKIKTNEQKHNRMNIQRKTQKQNKSDQCSLKTNEKENMSTDVKVQQTCVTIHKHSVRTSTNQHTTPCLRTPLAQKLHKTSDNVKKECDRIKLLGGANAHAQSKSVKPRRQSLALKSLDWDSALFTCEGLLNPKELCKINKTFKKEESVQSYFGTKKQIRPPRVTPRKQTSSDTGKDINTDIQKLAKSSKVSTNIGGPAPGQANSLSKKMNINTRNTKATTSPSSILSPLSFSSRSPTITFHKAISAADFQTLRQESCRVLKEGKLLTSPYATRSSTKKIEFSGLRRPSPRLGLFD